MNPNGTTGSDDSQGRSDFVDAVASFVVVALPFGILLSVRASGVHPLHGLDVGGAATSPLLPWPLFHTEDGSRV